MAEHPVFQAVRQRRTVYRFRSQEIAPEVLSELLEAATNAPNHRHTEPWRFVVVRGAALSRLADLRVELQMERSARDGKPPGDLDALRREVTQARTIVYVIQHLDADEKRQREDYASCAICAYILQLTAWERGIGARWHTGQLVASRKVRPLLGLADDEEPICYLALGYPDEEPKPWRKKTAQELTRYVE
ncbi:MAG: nitroreductase [Thermaerobacter sp.]|nr:nitroreductase [Thermaerobacter sp.]